jgi:hypothetical protein
MEEGGRRPGEGMNLVWVRAGVKNHFCPIQKPFAPLRLCAFALKMTLAKTRAVWTFKPVNQT